MASKAERAVILAAGAGRRLGAFTESHPKPLLPIHGTSILENCLTQLAANGITQTVLIVGHMRDQIEARIGRSFAGMEIDYVVSEKYQTTNNVYSLWCAREYLDRQVLLLEADLFFDGDLIAAVQDSAGDNAVAVARYQRNMDGTVVRLDAAGRITSLVEGALQDPDFDYRDTFKTVNIYRFSQEFLAEEFVPALDRTIAAGQTGGYYELLLKDTLARNRHVLTAVDCSALRWYEIDDVNDKRLAEYMFSPPQDRADFLNGQYGSYWRYGVVDHAYLYNMYFPPPDLFKRLGRDMELIIKQYPAGQAVMADLLSDVIDKSAGYLAVANGASELIRILCGQMGHRVIVPVPSFNEYENATPTGRLVRFPLSLPDFSLDVEGFAAQAAASGATLAVVVSPNNPSAELVPRDDLVRLCALLQKQNITLLLDESFVDFCDDPQAQSLQGMMSRFENLVLLKSMSKVYGIGGLRLGYIASANQDLVKAVRAQLPIWNINGFAEGFLRLMPRYRGEFKKSCALVRRDSQEFHGLLTAIPGMTARLPQANFVFLRVPEPWTSHEIAQRMFVEHDVLVKHCAQKSMPDGARYLRISTRLPEENRRFADILAAMTR